MQKVAIPIFALVCILLILIASCWWQPGRVETGTVNYDGINTVADKFTDDEQKREEIKRFLQNLQSEFHAFIPNLINNTEYMTVVEVEDGYFVFFSEAKLTIKGDQLGWLKVETDSFLLEFYSFTPVEGGRKGDTFYRMMYYNDLGMTLQTNYSGNFLWAKSINTKEFQEFIRFE